DDDVIVDVTIEDMERKFNINMADEKILESVLQAMQVDSGEIPRIVSAIQDWIDFDSVTRINGAESADYQAMDPPYFAKDRPIDDMSELAMVRGITQHMLDGPGGTNFAMAPKVDRWGRIIEEPNYPFGLNDIFTPFSSGKINVNTAPQQTLELVPGLDANSAAQIIKMRAGPDGVDKTEDDTPFHNVGELAMAVNPQLMPLLTRYCDVRSRTWKVTVVANVGGYKRTFHA